MRFTRCAHLSLSLFLIPMLVSCASTPPQLDEPPSTSLTASAPTASPAPDDEQPGRCGDGVCDGPETAHNCPQDCATEPAATIVPTRDTPAGAPLFLTTMIHMEGGFADDREEMVFQRHVEQLRYGLGLANEYGALMTVESEQPFARANEIWGVNMMQEILDLGHGVGTHCDVGYNASFTSVEALAQALVENKALVDALVGPENNRGMSGGASDVDWVLAAHQAGFGYVDGVVGMHYLSMPLENRPDATWTDEYIRTEGFHQPAPVELEERIYPFLVADAQDFVPDEEGVILISSGGIGRLDGLAEGGVEDCGEQCEFTLADADALVEQIRDVDAMRDPDRIAKLTLLVPVRLFVPENEAALRYFFEQTADLEEQGVVTWATQGQVYDAVMAEQ